VNNKHSIEGGAGLKSHCAGQPARAQNRFHSSIQHFLQHGGATVSVAGFSLFCCHTHHKRDACATRLWRGLREMRAVRLRSSSFLSNPDQDRRNDLTSGVEVAAPPEACPRPQPEYSLAMSSQSLCGTLRNSSTTLSSN
jgi:hypothetical protein